MVAVQARLADDVQSGLSSVNGPVWRKQVRHQHHVRLVDDALPAVDGGTIEHLAVGEEVFVNLVGRDGYVLLFYPLVSVKRKINKLDFVFLDQGQNVLGDMLK